jgi:hypothetical protein
MKPWHWLVLLTPAAEMILLNRFANGLGRYLFPRDPLAGLTVLKFNLPVMLLLSLALGIWASPKYANWFERVMFGIVLGITIAATNAGIAYAGCTAVFGHP